MGGASTHPAPVPSSSLCQLQGSHGGFAVLQVKDEKTMQEVFDLSDYEKCEELRKSKSRSKKNHSKFTLAHCRQPGNTVRAAPGPTTMLLVRAKLLAGYLPHT